MFNKLRIPLNCIAAALIAYFVLKISGNLEFWITYAWTNGGIPGVLSSLGWGNRLTLGVYDVFRFSFFSLLAVLPITFLRPQLPILYSLVVVFVIIYLFRYWYIPAGPSQAPLTIHLYRTGLIIMHLLTAPAMYWILTRPKIQSLRQKLSLRLVIILYSSLVVTYIGALVVIRT